LALHRASARFAGQDAQPVQIFEADASNYFFRLPNWRSWAKESRNAGKEESPFLVSWFPERLEL